MLRSNGRNAQLQEWYERLEDLVSTTQAGLAGEAALEVARRSGCALDAEGALRLTFFRRPYTVHPPTYAVQEQGKEPSPFTQSLILAYLATADGTPPSARWISYHDLPGGQFYARAFRGYAENRLVHDLGWRGVDAFHAAAERLDGVPIGIGSASYAFPILPRLHLAAVYWPGDEELSAQASILFEESAPHYMSTDGLAVLGSHLVGAIVEAAKG